MRVTEVTLRATVADHNKGPRDSVPQVAFAGRSNVGKSSLLNVLFGTRLAMVSKEPGKTRTINYYLVNRRYFFVDLPGYGYARTAQSERRSWGETVTAYLLQESRLKLVVGLIDPRIPTSPLDQALVEMVRFAKRELLLVLTKADQLGRGALSQARHRLTQDLDIEAPMYPFSARTKEGAREILAAIESTLAAPDSN